MHKTILYQRKIHIKDHVYILQCEIMDKTTLQREKNLITSVYHAVAPRAHTP